jgi:hypothetical protein
MNDDKWFYIAVAISFLGLFGYLSVASSSGDSSFFESPNDKKVRYEHEEKMLILQRDTMPKDNIIVIQGNKYKLEKLW